MNEMPALQKVNLKRLFNHFNKQYETASESLENHLAGRTTLATLYNKQLDKLLEGRIVKRYKVICDENNNPPEVIESNKIRIDITIKIDDSDNYYYLRFGYE